MKKAIGITASVCAIALLCCISLFRGGIRASARTETVKSAATSLAKKVSAIRRTPSSQSAFPTPASDPAAFQEIYHLGYAAAPYLIDYVIDHSLNDENAAFLLMAAANNLHMNKLPGAVSPTEEDAVYSGDADAYTPLWYARQFKDYLKTAPEKVSAICESSLSLAEKEKQLAPFGMLAVPTLQEYVNHGDDTWKPCIALLSLGGLEEQKRFRVLSSAFSQGTVNAADREDRIFAEKQQAVQKKALGADWLSANRQDLKILSDACSA